MTGPLPACNFFQWILLLELYLLRSTPWAPSWLDRDQEDLLHNHSRERVVISENTMIHLAATMHVGHSGIEAERGPKGHHLRYKKKKQLPMN